MRGDAVGGAKGGDVSGGEALLLLATLMHGLAERAQHVQHVPPIVTECARLLGTILTDLGGATIAATMFLLHASSALLDTVTKVSHLLLRRRVLFANVMDSLLLVLQLVRAHAPLTPVNAAQLCAYYAAFTATV
jgi:hypothetical protein